LFLSPKRNPNLLQRSEIVALMNTLHRISESLQSVDVFRKLYAKTQEEGQNKAIAIEGGGKQALPQAIQPRNPSLHLWYRFTGAIERLRTSCRRSISSCIQQTRHVARLVMRMIGLRQPSQEGKSTAARSEL
jgi:hypothetical protein